MNIIRVLSLLTIISLFTLVSYSSARAEIDCTNPKGFHQKMVCKLKGESPSKVSNDSNDSEEKKGLGGIWKKIKNFGGKNVGEAG